MTGPADDVTGGGNYLYFESSHSSGDTIIHPPKTACIPIDMSTAMTDAELSFYLHMYGDEMGELLVEISGNGGATFTTLLSVVGQQQFAEGDPWIPVGLDVSSYMGNANVVLCFTLQNATGLTNSDAAIDNILINSCGQPVLGCTNPAAWNYDGTANTDDGSCMNPTLAGVNCNSDIESLFFYEDANGLSTNSGPFGWTGDWYMGSGTNNGLWHVDFETPSGSTGPILDADGNLDNFIYFESSSGPHIGPLSIETPPIDMTTATTAAELSFYFHSYGDGIGDMDINISIDGGATFTNLTTFSGEYQQNEDDPWNLAGIDLTPYLGNIIILHVGLLLSDVLILMHITMTLPLILKMEPVSQMHLLLRVQVELHPLLIFLNPSMVSVILLS